MVAEAKAGLDHKLNAIVIALGTGCWRFTRDPLSDGHDIRYEFKT